MDHDRMLAVLADLADGIDPVSGTPFPADSPYQHPETVRALFLALRLLDAAGSASKLRAAGSASKLRAAGSASKLQAAGSASKLQAAGSASISQAAEATDISNVAPPSTQAEASTVGRKPSVGNGTASKGGNAGKAWTPEEDQRLAAAFDGGGDIDALAKAHGRSRLALEIRLAKLGRLPMPEKTLYGNKPQPHELPQTVPPADVQPTRTRSVNAPRRASESGALRYRVATSIASIVRVRRAPDPTGTPNSRAHLPARQP